MLLLVVLGLLSIVAAQCQGACQDIGDYCPNSYVKDLCPGPDNIQCCPEDTSNCPGQCQDNSLPCSGSYVADLCPGPADVQCCENNAPPSPPASGCAGFADAEWNCGDPACSYRVNDGDAQPNYACAEFVSRSLAAGGLIPLSPYDAQSSYGSFSANGKTYDLLWVSSRGGGPLGLEDYLRDSGWQECGTDPGCTHECSALMVVGADGAWGHTVVGVGDGVCDAHNNARHDVPPTYYNIDDIWNPPANVKAIVAKQRAYLDSIKPANFSDAAKRPSISWKPSN